MNEKTNEFSKIRFILISDFSLRSFHDEHQNDEALNNSQNVHGWEFNENGTYDF